MQVASQAIRFQVIRFFSLFTTAQIQRFKVIYILFGFKLSIVDTQLTYISKSTVYDKQIHIELNK